MRLSVFAGATCVLAFLIAGTAAITAAATAADLRIGLAEYPDALDPTLTRRTVAGRIVFAAVCDKLFDISTDLQTVPRLAAASTRSDDKRTLTLTLRDEVRFYDGEPLDAAAVKYNLERHLTFLTLWFALGPPSRSRIG